MPILIIYPIYIWSVLLRKKVPKLFIHLGIGILICISGVVCLFVTDIIGHATNDSNSNNYTQCVFQVTILFNKSVTYHSLHMQLAALILPGLLGIGPLLVVLQRWPSG